MSACFECSINDRNPFKPRLTPAALLIAITLYSYIQIRIESNFQEISGKVIGNYNQKDT
jgi:hypothetical protein